MVRTVILVPLKDNSGKVFPNNHWHELEQQLLQLAGGFSREGPVDGTWTDGERVYKDRSRRYIVALDSWTKLPDWLAAVKWAKDRFNQEAMYIEVNGAPEILG